MQPLPQQPQSPPPFSGLQIDRDRQAATRRAAHRLANAKSNYVPRPEQAKTIALTDDLRLSEGSKDARMYALSTLIASAVVIVTQGVAHTPSAIAQAVGLCVGVGAALFIAGRAFAALSSSLGGFIAAVLTGVVPAVITAVHVAIHDAAPSAFRFRNTAILWVLSLGALIGLRIL